MNWIKVSDKLPEMRTDVLAADSFGDVGIGYFYLGYQDKLCFADAGDQLGFPTHWQELPAPPEAEHEQA